MQRVIINETGNIAVKMIRGLNRQAGNPTVTVFLTNPVASFDVIFHKDHLDVNWKMQTNEMDGSHGLLGTKYKALLHLLHCVLFRSVYGEWC